MTSATINSATATYTYDPNGLRDSRTFDGVTTHYTWSWGSSLPVILCDGSTHYIYGNGRIMATDGSGNVEAYYLYDGLGSVANVTDDEGNVLVTYTYDAFGGIRTQSAASDNYWTFTGEQTDEESSFQYLRARYYDPEIGRFISNDPLGGGYPYAGNNPLSFLDPSGLALTVVCDSFSGGVCTSAHYEGTVAEMQTELQVLTDGGYGATAAAELLRDAVDNGGAPLDDAATAVFVAVETSAEQMSASGSAAGGSTVVKVCSAFCAGAGAATDPSILSACVGGCGTDPMPLNPGGGLSCPGDDLTGLGCIEGKYAECTIGILGEVTEAFIESWGRQIGVLKRKLPPDVASAAAAVDLSEIAHACRNVP